MLVAFPVAIPLALNFCSDHLLPDPENTPNVSSLYFSTAVGATRGAKLPELVLSTVASGKPLSGFNPRTEIASALVDVL